MKIARLPSKRKNIILILILTIGLPILIYASYQVVQLISNASADTQPRNITLSNLSTSSAVISWVTDSSLRGSLTLVENGTEGTPVIDKRGNDKRYTHYIELTGLNPNTAYNFVITSGNVKYTAIDNVEFTFKTAPIASDAPTPNPIYGTVENISSDDVILFAETQDKSTYPVSTTMPDGGNWIMDLSAFRKTDDKSLVISSSKTSLVITAVSGFNKGGLVSGSYSELFDSNGKLNATKTILVGSNNDLYSYFPSAAKFEKIVSATDNQDAKNDDNNDTTTNTDTNNSANTETSTGGKVFRIVQDLTWTNMISNSNVIWSYGATTVQVTNLTDTGFTVTWISRDSEQGYIKYGTSVSSLSNQAIDERDSVTSKGDYYTHSVSLTRLQPETKYYFNVFSGDDIYNNNENSYNATTFATLSSAPAYVSISGVVQNLPSSREAIVIAYLKDSDGAGSSGSSEVLSTMVDDNGKWILSIADSRTIDGSGYFEYTNADKIYFKIISTAETQDVVSKSLDGITSNDIELSIVDTTSLNVNKLSSYGVI